MKFRPILQRNGFLVCLNNCMTNLLLSTLFRLRSIFMFDGRFWRKNWNWTDRIFWEISSFTYCTTSLNIFKCVWKSMNTLSFSLNLIIQTFCHEKSESGAIFLNTFVLKQVTFLFTDAILMRKRGSVTFVFGIASKCSK